MVVKAAEKQEIIGAFSKKDWHTVKVLARFNIRNIRKKSNSKNTGYQIFILWPQGSCI